jgi:hypothetical protein
MNGWKPILVSHSRIHLATLARFESGLEKFDDVSRSYQPLCRNTIKVSGCSGVRWNTGTGLIRPRCITPGWRAALFLLTSQGAALFPPRRLASYEANPRQLPAESFPGRDQVFGLMPGEAFNPSNGLFGGTGV